MPLERSGLPGINEMVTTTGVSHVCDARTEFSQPSAGAYSYCGVWRENGYMFQT